MNALRNLHEAGQSLWLDNITRTLLENGGLQRYIGDFSITGLTSNPSIFQKAIAGSDAYRAAIGASRAGNAEALFFELALDDLARAADLFAPIHRQTQGTDGWVSLEVSPLLADDTEATVAAATDLHRRAARENLFIKIPGNAAGCRAIEEATFAGVPINVTLLFSARQLLAAAEAWMRGIERRIAAGMDADVTSVLSLFVSRWDTAVAGRVPAELNNRLGIAVARRAYAEYLDLCATPRWKRLADAGAAPQRLLWASTGTKDPQAPETLYVEALAAPDTINTLPEKTIHAFAEHGKLTGFIPRDGAAAAAELERFIAAGIDIDALAERLQEEGKQAFDKSWRELLGALEEERSQRAASRTGGAAQ
jgi:transaldolase